MTLFAFRFQDADWKASVVNQASQGVKDLQKKTSQVRLVRAVPRNRLRAQGSSVPAGVDGKGVVEESSLSGGLFIGTGTPPDAEGLEF